LNFAIPFFGKEQLINISNFSKQIAAFEVIFIENL